MGAEGSDGASWLCSKVSYTAFLNWRYRLLGRIHGRDISQRFMGRSKLSGWRVVIFVIRSIRIYYHQNHDVLFVRATIFHVFPHCGVGPMIPLLTLLQCVYWWSGMNFFQFLEKFCKNSAEIDQSLLKLIYRRLWEFTSRIMKNVNSRFTFIPHQDITISHHIEVGYLSNDFIFSYFMGPF